MKEFLIIKLYTLIIWLCKAYEATMLHANHISPRLMELCVKVGSLCAGLLSFFDGCVYVCFLLYSRHDGIVHRKTAFPAVHAHMRAQRTTFSAAVIAIVADVGPQVSVDS